MANETIYGCVDWTDGSIIFEQDACEYPACIIWTGEHAGQVAVTIDNDYCDDIYYGCVDWITGKFEVIVPIACCPPTCPVGLKFEFDNITECFPVLGPLLPDCGLPLKGIRILNPEFYANCEEYCTDDEEPCQNNIYYVILRCSSGPIEVQLNTVSGCIGGRCVGNNTFFYTDSAVASVAGTSNPNELTVGNSCNLDGIAFGADKCDINCIEVTIALAGHGGSVVLTDLQCTMWSATITYEIGDKVAVSGTWDTAWICTSENTNQQPPNATYWDEIVP